MRQAESFSDTVQRRKNSRLRGAFFFLCSLNVFRDVSQQILCIATLQSLCWIVNCHRSNWWTSVHTVCVREHCRSLYTKVCGTLRCIVTVRFRSFHTKSRVWLSITRAPATHWWRYFRRYTAVCHGAAEVRPQRGGENTQTHYHTHSIFLATV